MTLDCDVVVVGAGISGLTVAFRLARSGRDVVVLEASDRAGGVIGTLERDGALYELGPNSTLDNSPLIDELLQLAGIRDERVDADAQSARRFVLRDGRLESLPMSPGAFLRTRAFTWRARLRLLREPFIAPAPPEAEESVAQFVQRRLGREFLDYAIDPFVAGIYAGDPHALSLRAAFPRLHALEQQHGSLIRGQLRGTRERRHLARGIAPRSPGPARHSFSFRGGMQALPDALARAVPRIVYGAPVAHLRCERPGSWIVSATIDDSPIAVRAGTVVLATPAAAASAIAASEAPDAASALAGIEYAPIAIVASLYRRSDVTHPLDGFGFLVPRVERRRILGCLFSSTMFAGRAPAGTVLLTTFVGGRRDPGMAVASDARVAASVRDELAAILGAGAPVWEVVTRWERAIPQYALGHLSRMAALESAEGAHPGLHFCGSYRGGVSVADCITSASALAARILGSLQTR